MTQQFTVRIVGSGPEADLHRKVLASLPEPFQIVPTGKVDAVLLMDGEPAPLDARVAVIADVSARKQSSLSGAIGLPAVRYLPRLTADGGFERARKSQFALVSVGVVTAKSDPEGMLRGMVEALATVRWLTNASCQIAGAERSATGIVATLKQQESAPVTTLSVHASPTGGETFTLNAVGLDARLHAHLDADAIARPGHVELFGIEGATRASLVHQNDHRLTWLSVHSVFANDKNKAACSFEDWQQDIAQSKQALAGK